MDETEMKLLAWNIAIAISNIFQSNPKTFDELFKTGTVVNEEVPTNV